jgi:hypothetical protein
VAHAQDRKLKASAAEKPVPADEERIRSLPHKRCEGCLDLADAARLEHLDFEPEGSGRIRYGP